MSESKTDDEILKSVGSLRALLPEMVALIFTDYATSKGFKRYDELSTDSKKTYEVFLEKGRECAYNKVTCKLWDVDGTVIMSMRLRVFPKNQILIGRSA